MFLIGTAQFSIPYNLTNLNCINFANLMNFDKFVRDGGLVIIVVSFQSTTFSSFLIFFSLGKQCFSI